MAMKAFDFVNSIRKKQYLDDSKWQEEEFDKEYVMYVINKAMAGNIATIMQANEMNRVGRFISNRAHYEFLYHSTPPVPFSEWVKPDKSKWEVIDFVRKYYDVSRWKAIEIIDLATPEQIEHWRFTDAQATGGRVK